MQFPCFDGENPCIWRDKYLDYFQLFNVHDSLWVVSATMHMEGNAARWYQSYKQRHRVGDWTQFMNAVEASFGSDEYHQFVSELLTLKQRVTVQEYHRQFEELMYKISGHNPYYDELFFVTQFIKGLKAEIRGMVESQLPETVSRAVVLAKVQQDLSSRNKPWAAQQGWGKQDVVGIKPAAHTSKQLPGDLWKDRQLCDYRRANGLCYHCGDKI